jgi:hypothetical protein
MCTKATFGVLESATRGGGGQAVRSRAGAMTRLASLAAEAGLDVVEQYGTWDREPFTADSAEIISVLAARPARGR